MRGDSFPVFSKDLSASSSGRRYFGRRLHQASPTSRSRRGQRVGGWIGGHRSKGDYHRTHHRACEHAGSGRLAGLRAAFRGVQLSDGGGNGINSRALSEACDGVSGGLEDIIFLRVATEIGNGILPQGLLRRAVQGAADAIGHAGLALAEYPRSAAPSSRSLIIVANEFGKGGGSRGLPAMTVEETVICPPWPRGTSNTNP